jgi:hypothetical protein
VPTTGWFAFELSNEQRTRIVSPVPTATGFFK